MTELDLVLTSGEQRLALGRARAGERCDLAFADDLLQLQLVLRRFGWRLTVEGAPEHMDELLELMGLRDHLTA